MAPSTQRSISNGTAQVSTTDPSALVHVPVSERVCLTTHCLHALDVLLLTHLSPPTPTLASTLLPPIAGGLVQVSSARHACQPGFESEMARVGRSGAVCGCTALSMRLQPGSDCSSMALVWVGGSAKAQPAGTLVSDVTVQYRLPCKLLSPRPCPFPVKEALRSLRRSSRGRGTSCAPPPQLSCCPAVRDMGLYFHVPMSVFRLEA
jgi:hypothetical protein